MPRKKVNDNIISVRMQNIRLRGEIIAVNRRIGGLEMVIPDLAAARPMLTAAQAA